MAQKSDNIIEPITDGTFDDVVGKILGDAELTAPPAQQVIAGNADSPLRIGGAEIDCYVLEDETRVLSQRGLFKGLGVTRGGPRNENEPLNTGAELPRFASQKWLQPYIDCDLENALKSPVFFQPPSGHVGYGYPAEILVDICDAIFEADKRGATGPRQEGIVGNALSLMRGVCKSWHCRTRR